jgi:hypothetical protein
LHFHKMAMVRCLALGQKRGSLEGPDVVPFAAAC